MKVIQDIEVLSESDDMLRELTVDKGKVISFVAVSLMVIGGVRHQIARYDCSHGYVHKDCFYEKTPSKERLPDRSLKELYKMASEVNVTKGKSWRVKYIQRHLK
mgnify:CR=1 FL=1